MQVTLVKGSVRVAITESLPEDIPDFGGRLKWAIKHSPLRTNTAVADVMGIKRPQISNWIGREKAPDETTVERLSDVLEVPREWLRYGVVRGGGEHNEPEAAWFAGFLDVVRRDSGKNGEGLTESQRESLIDDLNVQITLARRRGISPARLQEVRDRLERGEPI